MSFNQILLALDRTPRADDVFAAGLDIAKKYNAQLMVLHCIARQNDAVAGSGIGSSGVAYPWPSTMVPTTSAPITAPAADVVAQEELQIAQDWLGQFQRKAEAADIRHVSTDVQVGQAGDRICEAAKNIEADLIVVGRHDRSGIEEFLLGSVSNHVVHNAPSAVLLIPQ
ncbi:universal stress protein [Leptolyngbya iicbica]|uniref:Universal stress protein n=2 Tax=Cyanophyceae TaxID=3028117 RepID=A0A4Q7EBU6_9CYAN|nr:universal stress protein [Leptolyngbya sp. LK]RZM78705.1 universal stress protein [Leptolyngbya sp. LK]